jgi:hypothetical protein
MSGTTVTAKKQSMDRNMLPFGALDERSLIRCLTFKCEDYTDDGLEIGPLYARIGGRGTVRSTRYVTTSEAKSLAHRCGAELREM